MKRLMTIAVVMVAMALAGCGSAPAAPTRWEIQNPYAGVDWVHDRQYKANLHTHTTLSDGREIPGRVIDCYAQLGYAILALTDHDTIGPGSDSERRKTTWPWRDFGRDSETVGMVAIEGNEISRLHNIGSYFNDYGDAGVISEDRAIEEIGRRNGLAVFCHPGRYGKSVAWYADLFRSYSHLIGIEIYNQGDRYPNDRKTWDAILTEVIDERPVWGFSNDDMHDPSIHLGHNWNVMFLPELSAAWVRRAMEEGFFFYVYAPQGHQGRAPPEIKSVTVDSSRGLISIRASRQGRVEWISAGRIVHQGDSIDLAKTSGLGGYVRAVVYAAEGDAHIGTQPFRLIRKLRD